MDQITSILQQTSVGSARTTIRGIRCASKAFTLIELLAVIAILGILSAFVAPSVVSVSRGSNLNFAGQMIADQLSLARQEAVTRNRDMEVRFYQWNEAGNARWRAVQLLRIDQTSSGPITVASSRITVIPEGIVITDNESLSPLITASPRNGATTLPGHGEASYRAFRFRANGSLENAIGNNNFLTLLAATDSNASLSNYYTIQINPLTGKVSVFRP